MADRKDRMALLSRYNKLHTQHYGQKPTLNLNVEQWAADALIESYTLPGCYDLLAYYFEVAQAPSWNYFAYSAETLINSRAAVQTDQRERAERRQMARKWLSE